MSIRIPKIFGYFISVVFLTSASLKAENVVIDFNPESKSESIQSSKKVGVTTSLSEIKAGETITINGLPGSSRQYHVTKAEVNDANVMSVSANGPDAETLLLSLDSGTVYGSLNGNGLRYSIASDSSSRLQLVDQTHEAFPKIDLSNDIMIPPGMLPNIPGIDQIPGEVRRKIDESRLRQNKEGDSNIRILFVHSTEFGSGFSSPSARINQLIAFTNSSLERSGIDIEFTVAHIEQLGFDNEASTSANLSLATNGEGAFSGVPALRDLHGADMVAVLSFSQGFSSNGVAWINGSNPNLAYSSTRLSPNCCDSVFAHELGHNMGSGHERESVNPSRSSPCNFNFTGYSCGHGNQSNGWGTIMSRLNSDVVDDLFSNPGLSCLGEPCGVAEGQSNSADNFKSFNITRLLTADFRPDPAPVVTPPTTPTTTDSDNISVGPIMILLLDE